MDAFELLKQLPDKSVDLVLIDPPYNIGKDEWDKVENYTEWFGSVLKEIERVLKENGSFYFWHNQFPTIAKIQGWIEQNTKFIFKSLITWEKYQTNKQYFGRTVLMGVNNTSKRNYFPMAEYCLFYVCKSDEQAFENYLDYMTKEKINLGWNCSKINEFLNYKSIANHWFKNGEIQNQPRLIQKKDYKKLQETGFFQMPYNELVSLFNDLRYTFNFVRTDITTTWLYPPTKKEGHLTPKPLEIIKDIISHSSNKGDVVLDCFVGSGTTAVACKKLGRNFICCDNNAGYVEIANKRLAQQSVADFTLPNGNPAMQESLICVKEENQK